MKHTTFFFLLMLSALLSVSCNQSKTKKKSSDSSAYNCTLYPYATGCTNNSTYCQQNPTAYGCPGYTGTTTGSTAGGTSACNPPAASEQTTCANYCYFYPGTSGCLTNGTNCKTSPTAAGCPQTVAGSPSYGALYGYSNAIPADSCSAATVPASNPYAYETWKGTMTVVGAGRTTSTNYDPMRGIYNPEFGSGFYTNTDPTLTTVTDVQNYFVTDSTLKVRFKVKPQPTTSGVPGCYNRASGFSAQPNNGGYTKLQFNVYIKGIRPDGSRTAPIPVGTFGPVGLNACTPAINLANYKLQYPDGLFVIVDTVQSNQGCSFNQTQLNSSGFSTCQVYGPVRSADCWALEMEVASGTTKTFN